MAVGNAKAWVKVENYLTSGFVKPLFLWGPNGCGKTYAVSAVAKKLKYTIYDTENIIKEVQRFGTTLTKALNARSRKRGILIFIDSFSDVLGITSGLMGVVTKWKPGKYPLIICSDSRYGIAERRVAPRCLEVRMFPPFASQVITFLKKKGMRGNLKKIAELSRGDMRQAQTIARYECSSTTGSPSPFAVTQDVLDSPNLDYNTILPLVSIPMLHENYVTAYGEDSDDCFLLSRLADAFSDNDVQEKNYPSKDMRYGVVATLNSNRDSRPFFAADVELRMSTRIQKRDTGSLKTLAQKLRVPTLIHSRELRDTAWVLYLRKFKSAVKQKRFVEKNEIKGPLLEAIKDVKRRPLF